MKHTANESRRSKSYDVSVRRNKRWETVVGRVVKWAAGWLQLQGSESFADSAKLLFSTVLTNVMVLAGGVFERGLGHEHRTHRNGNPALKEVSKNCLDPFIIREHS